MLDLGLVQRFWAKVNRGDSEDCWLWTAYRNPDGYGEIGATGSGKTLKAHRVSYEMHAGPIPSGLVIDHICRNQGCVNPTPLGESGPSAGTVTSGPPLTHALIVKALEYAGSANDRPCELAGNACGNRKSFWHLSPTSRMSQPGRLSSLSSRRLLPDYCRGVVTLWRGRRHGACQLHAKPTAGASSRSLGRVRVTPGLVAARRWQPLVSAGKPDHALPRERGQVGITNPRPRSACLGAFRFGSGSRLKHACALHKWVRSPPPPLTYPRSSLAKTRGRIRPSQVTLRRTPRLIHAE